MNNQPNTKPSLLLLAALTLAGCSSGSNPFGNVVTGVTSSMTSMNGGGSTAGGTGNRYLDSAVGGAKMLQSTKTDPAQEDELGRSVAIAVTNKYPLYDKAALNKYVTLVGLAVASASDKADGPWVFGVLDTPEIGAYSGPNGYIMLTRGAINLMSDESELAGVLAHEISHSLNHDGMSVVKRSQLFAGAMDIAAANEKRVAAFRGLSDQLVNTVVVSGWNQEQETAADAKAVKLLGDSGYDAHGLTRFLQKLAAAKGGSAKPFGTHPGTADRISRTTAAVGANATGATNKDRFVREAADAKL